MWAVLGWLLATAAPVNPELARSLVAESALRNARSPDADWEPAQRDCAGLVRHVYRRAFRSLAPMRLHTGLWADGNGGHVSFADAQTLVRYSFSPLGRSAKAEESVRTGDLLVFAQPQAGQEPQLHVMMVLQPRDRAEAPTQVVYHPGSPQSSVRLGSLRALHQEPPPEWRPEPENPAFLGFFRFKEWMP